MLSGTFNKCLIVSALLHLPFVLPINHVDFLGLKKEPSKSLNLETKITYVSSERAQAAPIKNIQTSSEMMNAPTSGKQALLPKDVKESSSLAKPKSPDKMSPTVVKNAPVSNRVVERKASFGESQRRKLKRELVPTAENIDLSDEKTKEIFFGYYDLVREKIKRNTIYPFIAKNKKIQGTAYVSFILKRNGRVKNIVLLESSGDKSLDSAGVKCIESSDPFLPFPNSLASEEVKLNIPISFELK